MLITMYGPPKDRLESNEAGIERKVGELFTDPKGRCTVYLWGQTGRLEIDGFPEAVEELCEQLKRHRLLKKCWTAEPYRE